MKNKEYLNIVFGRISPLLKAYNLTGKDLHLVNDTFRFILNSDNILRDLFVLSSAHKLTSFVNYILFILKKIEEDKINYSNLSYNVETDTKFLEKEIKRYFSVDTEAKEVIEEKKVKQKAPKELVEEVNEYTDETISDFYNSPDDDSDNEITSENQSSKRGTLELLDVERNDEELNAVFDLPETGSFDESSIEENYLPNDIVNIREEITSEPSSTESDSDLIQEVNDYTKEFQSEFEKFSGETTSVELDADSIDSIKEEKSTPTSDNSYWEVPDEVIEEEKFDDEIIEDEEEITEAKADVVDQDVRESPIEEKPAEIISEEKTDEVIDTVAKQEEDTQIDTGEKIPKEIDLSTDVPLQAEMIFESPEEPKPEEVKSETGKSKVLTEDVLSDETPIKTSEKEKAEEKFEEQFEEKFEEKKKSDELSEQKKEEQKEEQIEESNEEFVQYETYVLKTNEELRHDFEKMVEFAKRLNKNYDERNLIINEVIEKTSFLENCSRELSLEVITNIYETFKLSFEKISDGKYDLSEDTLSIFLDSLSLIESLLKGDDYLAYDSLIKSLDKLRKNLLREKKTKEKEELKVNEEKNTETVLNKLYEDEHKLFIANNIRRKISDIEKIFNGLNDIESNYVQIEALTLLASNLNNFKELVSYANTIGLVSLAKVSEGGYILIKYLQNYRKDPTEEIWKETFKYIIYVMRLLILDKPVEDLDLFISYLNEPIKIYLSKEPK